MARKFIDCRDYPSLYLDSPALQTMLHPGGKEESPV